MRIQTFSSTPPNAGLLAFHADYDWSSLKSSKLPPFSTFFLENFYRTDLYYFEKLESLGRVKIVFYKI